MKKIIALLLVAVMCLSLVACGGQSEAAKALDEKILTLGEITIDSKELLEEIDTEYENLTDQEKSSLENYDVLKTARDTYNAQMEKIQSFAEGLSLFARRFNNPENVKFNNCWYYYDTDTEQHYFTFYISTMTGQDYQYWGNKGTAFAELSDEELQEAKKIEIEYGFYRYSDYIKQDGKVAAQNGGIELDADAIQDYYMRNS